MWEEEVSKTPDQVMKVIPRAVELMNEGHEDVNSFLVFLKSRPTVAKIHLLQKIESPDILISRRRDVLISVRNFAEEPSPININIKLNINIK